MKIRTSTQIRIIKFAQRNLSNEPTQNQSESIESKPRQEASHHDAKQTVNEWVNELRQRKAQEYVVSRSLLSALRNVA